MFCWASDSLELEGRTGYQTDSEMWLYINSGWVSYLSGRLAPITAPGHADDMGEDDGLPSW